MASVADHLITKLRDAGVRALFGVPGGGGNLDLIEAAGRGGIPFVLTSTETGAAIAAIAQAEITGKPGACLTTLGPGAASVVNGVACAYLDRAPIVVFTDSHAIADGDGTRISGWIIRGSFAGITRFSGTLAVSPPSLTMAAALQAIKNSRSRAHRLPCKCRAHFADRAEEMFEQAGGLGAWTSVTFSSRNDMSIDEVLRQARKPVVIAGLGARRPEHANAIRALCERHGLPALVTYKAKGVIPDDHPWFAGVFTNGAIERPVLAASDLVIGFGLDEVELLPRPWSVDHPLVSFGPLHAQSITDGIAHADAACVQSSWNVAEVRAMLDVQRQAIAIPGTGLTAQRVVEVAAARLARDCRVTVDAGAHMFPATMLWPVSEPNQMLISNGLSTMGFALLVAIGAALLDRDRPVVALTGDGGLLMCMGELLTAVRERLKIIVIVFSDASLSLIEIKQQARKLAPAGVALGAMDWPAIARGFGANGFVAGDEKELGQAIDAALGTTGPSLIEAKIDRSNYSATLKAVRG